MIRTVANPYAHVCRVCGRRAQEGDLCFRHGGSGGLIIETEGLSRGLRYAVRALVIGAVLTLFLGILLIALGTSVTGREDLPGYAHLLGAVAILVAVATTVATMYLSQLRPWSPTLTKALCAVLVVACALAIVIGSPSNSFRVVVLVMVVLPYGAALLLISTNTSARRALQEHA